MSDFLPVPAWVVGRSDVSWGAKVLLGALYAYDRKRRTEWPSVAQLCEDMKSPRRTVTRWLEELTGAGLVTSNRDGREVLYAPATCAKTGARRDLDSSADEPTGHAPEVAHVETSERRSEVAHVQPGHGSEVAHVADSHLLLKREREEEREGSARATPAGIVEASYAAAVGRVARYVANPSRDLPHWRSAVAGVEALGVPGETFRGAAERLAAAYVSERRTRSPEYFAEWLQKRAAQTPAQVAGGYAPPSTNHECITDEEIASYAG
jgi:DNA-binding transcriptional ArsR family regulator